MIRIPRSQHRKVPDPLNNVTAFIGSAIAVIEVCIPSTTTGRAANTTAVAIGDPGVRGVPLEELALLAFVLFWIL